MITAMTKVDRRCLGTNSCGASAKAKSLTILSKAKWLPNQLSCVEFADGSRWLDFMTWVEMTLIACVVAIVAAIPRRRTAKGRAVIWTALALLIALIAIYGREFFEDLI
jgi:hypothetical protein